MKAEWRLFGLVSGFLYVACIVYAAWTRAELGDPDWIGTVALFLSGTLCLMCASYFWLVSRRIDPRPEDSPEAEMSDGAGEIGFFSPGSYWPFGLALAAVVAGIGMVYWQIWLVAAGMLAVLFATGGLLFEYYTGSRRTAE
ncbi:MAG TPA: cytochrome c oxidase subunit 4 [Rugosimonospora sp.]|nr:cytochrome c oxidase subunit 4 [Rugosimonospora sp.]